MRPATNTRRRGAVTAMLSVALIAFGCVPAAAPPLTLALDLRRDATPRPAPSASAVWTCDGLAERLAELGPPVVRTYPLRGDPHFDPRDLGAEARVWYDLLWDAITDPAASSAITDVAASDDLYAYGRTLQTHVLSLLTAFRVTGDLALLDEVDRLAEHMRSRLRDAWRGTTDRTDGTRDGYLNWVYRQSDAPTHRGKDTFTFNEMRTHALVAQVASALHANRDLVSPNGVDYGARADTWATYLREHFEAKWRERNGTPNPRFPFLQHESLHATTAFVKYHLYLASMVGSADHAREATRLGGTVLDAFAFVDVDGQPAVVWPGRVPSPSDDHLELNATTYARYVVADAIDLHLEGADRWRDPALAAALATTVRSFVFAEDLRDASPPTFSLDIGGGAPQAGMEPPDPDRLAPFTPERYATSGLATVAAWDPTGLVAAWSCQVYVQVSAREPSVSIPAALLLASAIERETSLPPAP